MNRQVTDRLEFHKILDRLAACAASREAKEKCLDTHPLRSTAEAEKRLQETADAVGRVFADGQPSFGSLRDIRRSVISTGREYTLSPAELMDIASSLEATDAVRS